MCAHSQHRHTDTQTLTHAHRHTYEHASSCASPCANGTLPWQHAHTQAILLLRTRVHARARLRSTRAGEGQRGRTAACAGRRPTTATAILSVAINGLGFADASLLSLGGIVAGCGAAHACRRRQCRCRKPQTPRRAIAPSPEHADARGRRHAVCSPSPRRSVRPQHPGVSGAASLPHGGKEHGASGARRLMASSRPHTLTSPQTRRLPTSTGADQAPPGARQSPPQGARIRARLDPRCPRPAQKECRSRAVAASRAPPPGIHMGPEPTGMATREQAGGAVWAWARPRLYRRRTFVSAASCVTTAPRF